MKNVADIGIGFINIFSVYKSKVFHKPFEKRTRDYPFVEYNQFAPG